MKKCTILNCERAYYGRSFCLYHYTRIIRRGLSPEPDKRKAIIMGDIALIPLGDFAKDGYAVVDKEFSWVDKFKWHKNRYARRNIMEGGKLRAVFLHHVVLEPQIGLEVDHIDRDALNNRASNLRLVKHMDNMRNRTVPSKSGLPPGISKNNASYVARVYINKKPIHLGSFKTLNEAINARKLGEEKYYEKSKDN